jgi:hypothetical protein
MNVWAIWLWHLSPIDCQGWLGWSGWLGGCLLPPLLLHVCSSQRWVKVEEDDHPWPKRVVLCSRVFEKLVLSTRNSTQALKEVSERKQCPVIEKTIDI